MSYKQIEHTTAQRFFQALDWDNITMSYKDHRGLANELYKVGHPDLITIDNKTKQLRECGNYLQFTHAPNAGDTYLTGANFCHARLCPMCAWRLRVKTFETYRRAIFSIAKAPTQSYVHITLTIQNPAITSGLAFRADLDKLCDAYRRFRRRLHYADRGQYCLGTHGQLEVTINNEACTWHPHIHMLALVDQSFYKEQRQLMKMWRECLGDEGLTGGLFIQHVKGNDANLHRAVAEVCKYAVGFTDKRGNLLIRNAGQYDALNIALRKRRTSWDTGTIREAKRGVRDQDITIDDLKKAEDVLYQYTLGYKGGQYKLARTLVHYKEAGGWRTVEMPPDHTGSTE